MTCASGWLIPEGAGKQEIAEFAEILMIRHPGWTTVFFGDDVIHVKGKFRSSLREVTILATPARPADYLGFQRAAGTRPASSCPFGTQPVPCPRFHQLEQTSNVPIIFENLGLVR